MNPPVISIDPEQFWVDPYPALEKMRAEAPICFVPELDATLLCRRDDVFRCEKIVEVFSSVQPQGLMTNLMGENMMRKDGDAHMLERRQAQPSWSPRTVKEHWVSHFKADTISVLDNLTAQNQFDIVKDYALPVSANALRRITGLTNLSIAQMDHVSQAMIDGVSNYAGNSETERTCIAATQLVDDAIDEMLGQASEQDFSLIRVLTQAGQPIESIRANIKLAISGGQNEPRDAIAGLVYALLSDTNQLSQLTAGAIPWVNAFEEYSRWMSPIGMSPRRIAKAFAWNGISFQQDTKAFLMFGSANRDERIFQNPTRFDITRDTSKSVSFGAGPHFCAGASASRALIAQAALPMLFERYPNLSIDGDVEFRGWAFRGPLSVNVRIN